MIALPGSAEKKPEIEGFQNSCFRHENNKKVIQIQSNKVYKYESAGATQNLKPRCSMDPMQKSTMGYSANNTPSLDACDGM